jgi:hypothetical protein
VVILLTYGTARILLAGDADADEEYMANGPLSGSTNYREGDLPWLHYRPCVGLCKEATVEEATRLHEMVDRPNLFVKIPATLPGLVAIEEMISRGKSINVTLIFSLERYREVARAYTRGLQRLVENGGDPSGVHSVNGGLRGITPHRPRSFSAAFRPGRSLSSAVWTTPTGIPRQRPSRGCRGLARRSSVTTRTGI